MGCSFTTALPHSTGSCLPLRYTHRTSEGCASNERSQDDFHHEGVRAGRRQPPHDLQLDSERQGGVHPHRRRLGENLRRHAVASARPHRPDHQRSLMMPAADVTSGPPSNESPDLGLLFHRLNNQLGIILANAELLEAKLKDEVSRARATQIVSGVLDALATAREIRLKTR